MSEDPMVLTANIHRPRVERVAHIGDRGTVSAVLGNPGEYPGHVALIFENASAAITFAQQLIAQTYALPVGDEAVYCACGDLIGHGPTGDKPQCYDCKAGGEADTEAVKR